MVIPIVASEMILNCFHPWAVTIPIIICGKPVSSLIVREWCPSLIFAVV